jgi:hypothetical protein
LRIRSNATSVSMIVLLSAVLFGSSCGSSHSTQLRLANMTPDESSLDLLVDGSKATSANFGAASGYVSVQSGVPHVQVEPSGASTILIDQSPTIASGTDTTVFSLGFSTNVFPIIATDDNSAPASGKAKLRIVSGSSFLGTADVYVIAAGTDINTVSPTISSLAFGSVSSYQSVGAGSYQVQFTLPGQKFAYIDTGVLSLSSGQIRTVVGLNTSTGYTAAILPDLN